MHNTGKKKLGKVCFAVWTFKRPNIAAELFHVPSSNTKFRGFSPFVCAESIWKLPSCWTEIRCKKFHIKVHETTEPHTHVWTRTTQACKEHIRSEILVLWYMTNHFQLPYCCPNGPRISKMATDSADSKA